VRVARLYLRNYRVYEDPLELELPPGLVGIYGPNGAGKSALLESIRFTLFGRSRTANDEVRTSGVNAECIAEVEFEHEGHLYMVRRTVSGINSTVRAQASADGLQVAEGVRDTSRYVQSVLGMDDSSFRASVFAEQKQLSAFSQQAPAERRRLVLQLLGITPLDTARDLARKDSRSAHQAYERLRSVLPDLDRIREDKQVAEEASVAAADKVTALELSVAAAHAAMEKAVARHDRLDVIRQEFELLTADGKSARAEHDRAEEWVAKAAKELAELDEAAERLVTLTPLAEGWRAIESRLRGVEAVVAAGMALAALGTTEPPDPPDETACEEATVRAEADRSGLAEVSGRLVGANAERDRARAAVERSRSLTGEGDCPVCGQALGDSYAQVQAHRAAELAEAEARVNELELDRRRLAVAAKASSENALASTRRLKAAREAWAVHEKAATQRAGAERTLADARAQLASPMHDGELAQLSERVERGRRAADEHQRISGRLERRPTLVAELDVEKARLRECRVRLDDLRQRVASLQFGPEELAAARAESDKLRLEAEAAAVQAQSARVTAANALTRAGAEVQRLAEAAEQHRRLGQLGDDARHLDRLSQLLNAFRNTLVATVGPRLSTQAAALFAELTDNEYDTLQIDPETFEIKVRDAGLLYGMARFSGSETDLANLALRVAVSEQVRFQSGGAVGLLVLDEVFGPLDEERKERMLLALERLKARFRQVLVVTHDPAIKEQLPNAIEVVKLPGRRATARLINA